MPQIVKKSTDQLQAEAAKKANFSKASAAQIGKAKDTNYKNFGKNLQAISDIVERKTPDQYIKNDPEAARKQMEKNKDYLIKMIIANAKNIDPFDESGSKTGEMTQTMTTIAQIDAMMAQSSKMDEIVNAVKNPGFSATELQGKVVEYDDSKRYFDKSNVDFSYNIDYAEEYKASGTIKSTIEIVDSKNQVVFKTKGESKKGDYHFIWNGQYNTGSDAGKTVKEGYYNIRVKAEGTRIENGKETSFSVRSTAVRSGKVASVEIDNGTATGIMLENGKFIDKSQITHIRDAYLAESDVKLDPAFMDNEVNLDLSKIQVKDGSAEVYYNNHIKNLGAMEIKIQDKAGKFIKTVNYDIKKEVKQGINSVTLNNQIKELADGNYTVMIKVEDLDQNSAQIVLEKNFTTFVNGLNYKDNKVIIKGEKEISSHNIIGVISKNYMSIVDQANAAIGKKVTYRDDTMIFQEDIVVTPTLGFSKINKNDEDAILLEGVMHIYDGNNNLMQIIRAPYNPFAELTSTAQAYVQAQNPHIFSPFMNLLNYDNDLSHLEQININRYIETELAKEPANPNIIFAKEFKNVHKAKIAQVNFLWNGTFGDMRPNSNVLAAKSKETYRMEFFPRYIRPDGTEFSGETDFNKGNSFVKEAKVEGEVIKLILENGKEITEDLLLKVE